MRLSLTDRWFNPCDETVDFYAQMTHLFEKKSSSPHWQEVTISFDLQENKGELRVDDMPPIPLDIKGKAPAGLSYLVLQNTSHTPDFEGTLIKSFSARSR